MYFTRDTSTSKQTTLQKYDFAVKYAAFGVYAT